MSTKTTPYEDVQEVVMQGVWDRGRLAIQVITPGPHLGKFVRSAKAKRKSGAFYQGTVYTISKFDAYQTHCGLIGDYGSYWEIEPPR